MHSIFFSFYVFVLRAYFLKEKNIFQHCVNQIVKRGKGLDLGVEKIGDKLKRYWFQCVNLVVERNL